MEKLKTATGQEFDCDYFNPAPQFGQTNLRTVSVPLGTVAAVFSDPAETAKLECSGMVAENYTKLIAIVMEGDAIRVVLGKE